MQSTLSLKKHWPASKSWASRPYNRPHRYSIVYGRGNQKNQKQEVGGKIQTLAQRHRDETLFNLWRAKYDSVFDHLAALGALELTGLSSFPLTPTSEPVRRSAFSSCCSLWVRVGKCMCRRKCCRQRKLWVVIVVGTKGSAR